MRNLFLTALLLAAPAASAQPALAPTASSTNITLNLSAPVGTSVTLTNTVTSQMTLEDVQVSGPVSQKASAAEIASLRADIEKDLNTAARTTTTRGSYKVQGRSADGTVHLLITTVTNASRNRAVTTRLFQSVAPDGRTQITRVESDNPAVQAALQHLSQDVLQAQVSGSGGDPVDLYGQTFTVGQPRTQTRTVDFQAFLGEVLAALTSEMGAGNGKVQVTPLTLRTTTTYRGTNPSGQLVFDTNTSAENWMIDLGELKNQDTPMRLKMELLDMTISGQSLYRPDGLPVGSKQTQTARARLTFTLPDGSQMQLLMRLNQNTQLR